MLGWGAERISEGVNTGTKFDGCVNDYTDLVLFGQTGRLVRPVGLLLASAHALLLTPTWPDVCLYGRPELRSIKDLGCWDHVVPKL